MPYLVCLLAFVCAALTSAQTTIHVPADQPTIQAGIDAANNGDTVLVAPGTYKENINFKGKAITVTSSGGASVTTINGGNTPGVATVAFANGETNTSVISNFTIIGGGDTIFTGASDGGVYVSGASPTIQGNTITANYCHNIDVEFGSATILNNVISGVLQSTQGVGTDESYCTFGSGINLQGDNFSGPLGNTVIGNTIVSNLTGSAINLWAANNVLIMNNTISKNSSPNPGSAVISANSIGTVIVQNLIYDNISSCGGAIALDEGGASASNPNELIANNTMVDNVMSSQLFAASNCIDIAQIYPGSYGYGESGPGQVFLNNIISGSTSYPAVNCDWNDTPSESRQPTFQNDLLRNTGGAFFGSYCIDVSSKYNNIVSDAQFVNSANGDYHLKSSSPAIDAGQNSVIQTFLTLTGTTWSKDFDGKPRRQGNSCTIDMGAYESSGSTSSCSASVALTISSTPNPSLLNQSVTFTINSTASDNTHPGPITLTDTSTNTTLGSLTPDTSGNASYATSTLTPGNHTITATYAGSSTYEAATASLVQAVDYLPTALLFTSAPNPSATGQAVTFSATVETQYGTPTGSITFTDGTTTLATVALVNASATWTTSTLSAGQHIITATYPPNNTWNGSQQSITQIVNGLPTSTTITAAPNPAYAFQSIALTAHVTTTATGTPTGTVTFYDGATTIATASLATNGIATSAVSFPAASATPHQLTAMYNGDTSFNPSTSAAFPETIQFNPSTTFISTMVPNPVNSMGNATLSAVVSSSTSPGHIPTGTISFSSGGIPLGSGTLANGTVSVPIIAPAPGSYPVIASYSGDTAFFPGASPSQTLIVIPAPASVALSSTENPSVFGDSVTFTASVSNANPLTGTITFFDGKTKLGAAQLGTDGTATYATSTLAVGTHPITAVYSGNADVAGATSPVLSQVVQPYAGDFTLNVTPINSSIYTGDKAPINITATPLNGFDLDLLLSCSPLPANTLCNFYPARIEANPPPGSKFYTPYASVLFLETTAPKPLTSAAIMKRWTGGATALACLCGVLLIPRRIRRSLQIRSVLLAAILIGAFAAISGCGGGGTLTGGTPPGTYQITLTAQTSKNGPQLSHSVLVTVVVKSLF